MAKDTGVIELGSFNNYIELALLSHAFGGPDYDRPAYVYVGLSKAAIAEDGTGIDEPGGSYERVQMDNNSDWSNAEINQDVKAEISNLDAIAFPSATTDWGELTHFFISDAATGGNILGSGPLAQPITIEEDDQKSFPAGELIITLD